MEVNNQMRAEWAGEMLDLFQAVTHTDDCDLLTDALCDLMHWAKQNDEDFKTALKRAKWHFQCEAEEDSV